MEETIREIIAQADDERNFDLIRWVKDILDEFASTYNCPPDWRYIGMVLAGEYPTDSWVYENLELYNFGKIPEGVQNKYGNRIIRSHETGNAILERASSRIHGSESQEEIVSS